MPRRAPLHLVLAGVTCLYSCFSSAFVFFFLFFHPLESTCCLSASLRTLPLERIATDRNLQQFSTFFFCFVTPPPSRPLDC